MAHTTVARLLAAASAREASALRLTRTLCCAVRLLGVMQVDTFMLGMTRKVVDQLQTGRQAATLPCRRRCHVLAGQLTRPRHPCLLEPPASSPPLPPARPSACPTSGRVRHTALPALHPVSLVDAIPFPSPAASSPALCPPTNRLRAFLPPRRSHTVLGVDQSMVVLQSEVEDKSDVIAASSGSADLVGIRWAALLGDTWGLKLCRTSLV